MSHILDLPLEVLTVIITFMVMSGGDIRDWARVTSVCKQIYTAAIQPKCLRLVNCEPILALTDHEQHQHINGLLSRCVQAENPTADSVMAKVILFGGPPLWKKMLDNDETIFVMKTMYPQPLDDLRMLAKSYTINSIADAPYIVFSIEESDPDLCEQYKRLHPLRLMKSLITLAGPFDIVPVFTHLKEFIFFYVDYPEFTKPGGIGHIIEDMYQRELRVWQYEGLRRNELLLEATLNLTWAGLLVDDALKCRDRVIVALDKIIETEINRYNSAL